MLAAEGTALPLESVVLKAPVPVADLGQQVNQRSRIAGEIGTEARPERRRPQPLERATIGAGTVGVHFSSTLSELGFRTEGLRPGGWLGA
jgi:hypothetical protein